MARAPVSKTGGWGFESSTPANKNKNLALFHSAAGLHCRGEGAHPGAQARFAPNHGHGTPIRTKKIAHLTVMS